MPEAAQDTTYLITRTYHHTVPSIVNKLLGTDHWDQARDTDPALGDVKPPHLPVRRHQATRRQSPGSRLPPRCPGRQRPGRRGTGRRGLRERPGRSPASRHAPITRVLCLSVPAARGVPPGKDPLLWRRHILSRHQQPGSDGTDAIRGIRHRPGARTGVCPVPRQARRHRDDPRRSRENQALARTGRGLRCLQHTRPTTSRQLAPGLIRGIAGHRAGCPAPDSTSRSG
jgi:hypothetical protein